MSAVEEEDLPRQRENLRRFGSGRMKHSPRLDVPGRDVVPNRFLESGVNGLVSMAVR